MRAELPNIRKLARDASPMAMRQLVRLAQSAKSESARIAACNAILERGYGKPIATLEDGAAISVIVRHIVEGASAATPPPRVIDHIDKVDQQ